MLEEGMTTKPQYLFTITTIKVHAGKQKRKYKTDETIIYMEIYRN